MRRPWIKVETSTPDKPEICFLATALRMDPDTVVGKLVRLWSWMELNRVPANDLGVTKEFLDKLVGRKGFAEALVGSGWLVVAGQKLGFRNLERHNGGKAKIRIMTARRVALHRQRKLMKGDASVAEPLRDQSEAVLEPSSAEKECNDEPLVEREENEACSPLQDHAEAVVMPEAEAPVHVEPQVSEVEAVEPVIVTHEEEGAVEALPKKKRGRAVEDSPDQGLLF